MTRSVTILGSTGVIGRNTLEVIDTMSSEFSVVALTAGFNANLLVNQIRKYQPQYVAVATNEVRHAVLEQLDGEDFIPEIGIGDDGLITAAKLSATTVVSAIVGARGLLPTYAAVERGANILLANKETLVAAGDLVMQKSRERGGQLLPVDSEHSALLQCLHSGADQEVKRWILTASGGPFRTWTAEELSHVRVEDALKHPNWTMGQKITIDSATLMNKGLEVIEAHHLFNACYDLIDVVVHPQSVIHSMIEFVDGSVIAQLATPDMRLPIQYAMTYPHRQRATWPSLNLLGAGPLTFEEPNYELFKCLTLAYEAGRAGGYAPCVLNAANEVSVEAFLNGQIAFTSIARVVEEVLNQHVPSKPMSVEEIINMDGWARNTAVSVIQKGVWRT